MTSTKKCECECDVYYLDALDQARQGLVERARIIMKLRENINELKKSLVESERERTLAWEVCQNLVDAQSNILDNVRENILLQNTRRLVIREESSSSSEPV
jgi:hypothetical protein